MKKIESSQNATYKEWHKLEQKKWRDRSGQFIVEGPHLLEEALKTNQVTAVLMDEGAEPPYQETQDQPPLFELSHDLFKSLTQTETPQGMLAVVQLKKISVNWQEGRFLLVDAVQDPGNLGTMIRTADAAGFDTVILGKGTVDPYNPKTLRSAQGSHFHVQIVQEALETAIKELKSHHIPVIGTALDAPSLADLQPPKGKDLAIIMGNEGAGVQEAILHQVDVLVKIPMYGQAESLNVAVATGILTYWARG